VSSTNINKVIAFLGFYDFARAAILKNNREKNCSTMPEWHQVVLGSRGSQLPETTIKLCLYS